MKKIVLLGGTGFIGSHLFAKLAKNEAYDVKVFSRTPAPGLEKSFIQGDFRDIGALMRG